MSRIVKNSSWVEIYYEVLPAGERAPQVPDDTARVPLELRAKGFLLNDAEVGTEVEIETYTGRKLKGILKKANPSYQHKFGAPIVEMLTIGKELRTILQEEGR